SSHVDRSVFTDDSELNVESLIKNLKNRITSLLNSIEITKDICVFRNRNTDVILFYTHECEAFALVSEAILIENDNTVKTTLFHSQASLITFSFFSVRKIVCTLSCK
ncbi:hypothetical protein BDDG_01421, partial [Blastomyces dermatitidis ATCC 18188]